MSRAGVVGGGQIQYGRLVRERPHALATGPDFVGDGADADADEDTQGQWSMRRVTTPLCVKILGEGGGAMERPMWTRSWMK